MKPAALLRNLLFLIIGISSPGIFAQITFSEVIPTPFQNVSESSVTSSDVDLDGDKDVVIAGRFSGSSHITRLYLNDGNGVFTQDSNAGHFQAPVIHPLPLPISKVTVMKTS
jgi:hypothetical protein